MILRYHSKRAAAGWTFYDQLVLMAGCIPAFFLSLCFDAPWRMRVFAISIVPFGIALWCLIFLWLLPAWRRRSMTHPHSHDDDKPKAA